MNDTTGIEATNGRVLLVELIESDQVIRFLDSADNLIRAYDFAGFATLTGGLVLDEGASLVIDAATVAQVKQWANLDTIGRNLRNM